jgi:hypothetical protein
MGCQKLPHCRDKLFLLEEKFGMLPRWYTTKLKPTLLAKKEYARLAA